MEKEQLITLVKKSQSGDAEAIEKLLQYAHTSVSYQCRKMLNNEQDAEDMTQEVLVTIYTRLDTLQEPAAFWKWANQITATRCINALNRTHVEYQFVEDEEGHSILDNLEELDEQVIPDKAIDNAETTRMIEEIVTSLPDAQRAATLMFYYNEMSVKEIAAAMQVSENTVKSRLNYARKAIKEKVLDYEKQGVKLYGLSPLPFLLYFLRLAAQNSADKEAAGIMVAEIMAADGVAVGIAGASAAGAGGAAVAAGGSVTATAAATSAATGILTGISAKIAAGILAAVVTVGSVAAVVIHDAHREATESGTLSTEAISVMESTSPETDPGTEASEIDTPTEETTGEAAEESTESPTGEAAEESTEAPTGEAAEESTEAPTEEITEESTEASDADSSETVHQHSYECTITTPPTCSYGGEATYTCACGDSYTEAVPKNKHVWSEWKVTVEPTTTTYGKKVRTCELCYGSQEVNIDPITIEEGHEHSYTAYVAAPTCEESGYTTYTCSCGHTYTGDETAPTGHTFESVTIPPTTDAQGYDLFTCIYCGLDYVDNFTDPLPADETELSAAETAAVSEHTCDYVVTEYVAHTCTTGGWTTMTCTICGDAHTQYRVAQGHSFADGVCTYCGEAESP